MIRFICWSFSVFTVAALLSGCQHRVTHVAAAPPLPPDITPQMVSVPQGRHSGDWHHIRRFATELCCLVRTGGL